MVTSERPRVATPRKKRPKYLPSRSAIVSHGWTARLAQPASVTNAENDVIQARKRILSPPLGSGSSRSESHQPAAGSLTHEFRVVLVRLRPPDECPDAVLPR